MLKIRSLSPENLTRGYISQLLQEEYCEDCLNRI
ncbi:unnamed protein product [Strongylus vulgaris]|uniref:Uncharacterized protein n=1 Tax=Strongylus vulgaris TaxID=40348 RepID=A0A3P7M2H1_STRVU|nr:unnamed protein product [Strongylus vulgaris]